ncbi:hypothetical protein BT96DRAFT_944949 [Gymnopus androsaceus JB14]|uniref:Protein kinase domain-containing protein n=1 Tax=Gymnopus androsaceus JB14 TaxID=1447944 RepID=A0A6A4H2P3_9AGAR|nr:hypothetical protein BT96DRAFT_944949 [Gymnopus androsaceus JB14]
MDSRKIEEVKVEGRPTSVEMLLIVFKRARLPIQRSLFELNCLVLGDKRNHILSGQNRRDRKRHTERRRPKAISILSEKSRQRKVAKSTVAVRYAWIEVIPASLFDETLSQFQYDLTHCVPTPADIRCFARLRRQLTEIFEKEIDRQTKLIEILREENIIPRGGNLNPNTIGKYTTDGDVRTTTPCCYGDFLYFVQEIKNEFSTGKAEPYMEAIHYWWAHIRQHIERKTSQVRDRLNFPAILLVHAGSHFSVAVAALTDVLNVETLATIPLHVHSTNITGALDAGERFVDDKRVFRGSLKHDNVPLFIKFSRRYGEATHRRAQEVGLAPQLLSVEQIHGWYIVAMEDLSQSYETLHDVLYNGHDVDQARTLLSDVQAAVRKLHALGHVHGDIRPVNILVRNLGVGFGHSIVFVDWDWSGAIGNVCYPHNMNPAIKRSEDAVVGTEIKQEHDLAMSSNFVFVFAFGSEYRSWEITYYIPPILVVLDQTYAFSAVQLLATAYCSRPRSFILHAKQDLWVWVCYYDYYCHYDYRYHARSTRNRNIQDENTGQNEEPDRRI